MNKYEKYKNSGVDWIGDIPEHWNLISNKYIFKLNKKLVGKNSKNYDLLSLTLKGIIKRNLDNGGKFPAEFDSYQEVKEGNFIFCLFDVEETPRCVGLSSYNGMITGAYTVLSVDNSFNKTFLYYFYLYLDDNKKLKPLYTGLRNVITKEKFFDFKTYIPPLLEQEAIAKYLDEKTTKIEQAISQKEKMISLLKEEKQIIIQNAVTKGLNPNANLKDSGVEYIGEIPEHWEVKKLKNCLTSPLKYGANESGIEYSALKPRYIRITDFSKDGKLDENKKLSLSWEIAKDYLLEDGDILFARSGATVGKSYQFKINMSEEEYYSFAGYLIKASPDEKIILSDLLNYFTNSLTFENWKESILTKSTIENIGADKYSELKVIIPPINEQKEIVEYIDTKLNRIDKIIELQIRQIEKLKELKTTLIDNAVTGKIKVC